MTFSLLSASMFICKTKYIAQTLQDYVEKRFIEAGRTNMDAVLSLNGNEKIFRL